MRAGQACRGCVHVFSKAHVWIEACSAAFLLAVMQDIHIRCSSSASGEACAPCAGVPCTSLTIPSLMRFHHTASAVGPCQLL